MFEKLFLAFRYSNAPAISTRFVPAALGHGPQLRDGTSEKHEPDLLQPTGTSQASRSCKSIGLQL